MLSWLFESLSLRYDLKKIRRPVRHFGPLTAPDLLHPGTDEQKGWVEMRSSAGPFHRKLYHVTPAGEEQLLVATPCRRSLTAALT
jgi:hypothetical protein